MYVVIVDGQGGGIGKMLVEKLRARLRDLRIVAVGTNALATSAMLRAGADAGATGENAVCYNAGQADLLLGPSGIAVPNAMYGEVSPEMAAAVNESQAYKLLLSMDACGPQAPPRGGSIDTAADALVDAAVRYIVRSG